MDEGRGDAGEARRFFVAWRCRLGWIAGAVAIASGIHTLAEWADAANVLAGAILIAAGGLCLLGTLHARRPLVEIAGSELAYRPRYTSPRRLRQSLAEVFGASPSGASRSIVLRTRAGGSVAVPLSPLSRVDREAVVAEILSRIGAP